MTVDRIINLLVTVTLIEMMIALGLGVTLAEIIGVVKNRRLLIQAALANYVCVPAAAVGLLLLFRAQPMVAAGFLIAAVCPGAPYGPPFTALAKGNVAASVGLMVVLAGSSALLAPLLLGWLLPWMVIATSSFPGTPAVTATLAFALFQTVVMALVAVGWRRLPPLRSRVPSRAATASQPAENETQA